MKMCFNAEFKTINMLNVNTAIDQLTDAQYYRQWPNKRIAI